MKRLFALLLVVCTCAFGAVRAHAINNCTGATYYDANSDTCIPCPVGYEYDTTPGKTSADQCQINCVSGYYLSSDSLLCEVCPAGKYCTGGVAYYYDSGLSTDQGITGDVAAGYFSTGGATIAAPSASDCVNNNTCGICASGYSTGGATDSACTACPSNWETNGVNANDHDAQTDCQRTITLNKNGGSGTIQGVDGTANASIVCNYNTYCEFGSASGLTQNGYTFTGGWSTSKTSTSTTTRFKITSTAATRVYYAAKQGLSYTVTLNANSNDATAGTLSVTATMGADMPTENVTMPTRAGYTFLGYYDTSAATGGMQYYGSEGNSVTKWDIADNTTLYARWTPSIYTVTLNANSNDATAGTEITVATFGSAMPTVQPNLLDTAIVSTKGVYSNALGTYPYSDTSTKHYVVFFRVKPNTSYTYTATTAGNRQGIYEYNSIVDPNIYTTTRRLTPDRVIKAGGSAGLTTDTFTTGPDAKMVMLFLKYNSNSNIPSNLKIYQTDMVADTAITMPTRTGYMFLGYYDTSAATGGTQYYTQTGASAHVWDKTSDTTLYARWVPEFTVVTTNMTANDTFSFYIFAKGNFVIDWGDGTIEDITSTTTGNRFISHTYETAGVHNIRIGGLATEYDTALNNSTILFYNSGAIVGTPTKIARVEGSMGSVFPTLGSTSGLQPNFYRTFEGATNLTSVSSTLFNGVTGAREGMFHATFKGCSKLESIPSGLFTGISGAAVNLFRETFRGCSKITAIPSGLFGGVSGAAEDMFYETFFGCSKLASVPSGLFNGVSGAAPGLFRETFDSCSNLTTIPSGLFANVSGGAANMFYMTFAYCPKLSGIPSGLFNGVTTAAEGIFTGTFMMDTTLPSIPSGLFANVSGGAASAFWATFYGCTGLTGTIPGNLFSGITTAAEQEFAYAFSDCPNLSGYVPSTLFAGLNGTTATDLMTGVFEGTGLAESCPCGTHQYITGYEDDWSNKVSCEVGKKSNEHWNNGVCTTDCALGFTKLKTSNGLEYPLLADSTSTHSIHVGTANSECHVPLASGVENNNIHVSLNGATYHATTPDETVPVGFTGQPN